VNGIFTSLAKLIAVKAVAGLVALGVAAGAVIPLGESQSLTAALTLAIAAVLQVLWQVAAAWAEKKWGQLQKIGPVVFRVMLRSYSVKSVRFAVSRPGPPRLRMRHHRKKGGSVVWLSLSRLALPALFARPVKPSLMVPPGRLPAIVTGQPGLTVHRLYCARLPRPGQDADSRMMSWLTAWRI
jgi:hypothetical protein